MLDNREAIVGKSDSAIAKTLSIARSTVWKTLTCFNERGDLADHPRSGRPCTQTKW